MKHAAIRFHGALKLWLMEAADRSFLHLACDYVITQRVILQCLSIVLRRRESHCTEVPPNSRVESLTKRVESWLVVDHVKWERKTTMVRQKQIIVVIALVLSS
ncbi:hypothetical protein KC19_4G140900 [Ceratodon purpureus]|uniref:Uncharacterized protein n=1 Tax=Ceratodon purpureus TaxID=3225 RepID=A0A8T0IC47_CERPU|nr:hypothetical protein KC19_4G140900 [Ceratodon purpureus]